MVVNQENKVKSMKVMKQDAIANLNAVVSILESLGTPNWTTDKLLKEIDYLSIEIDSCIEGWE